MASSVQIPNALSPLPEQLLCDIGGSLHPKNAEFYQKNPEKKKQDQPFTLIRWVQKQATDQTESLDGCFQKAIQIWALEKIEELNAHKEFQEQMLEYAQQPGSKRNHKILSLGVAELIRSEEHFAELPPAASWKEDDADMVIVEDPLAEQLAILNKWKEQPSLVLEAIPQIRAALEYLKSPVPVEKNS